MAEKQYGWIKISRSLQDHWLWSSSKSEPFSKGQAWIDMIMLANHEDNKMVFDGSLITVKKGDFITSEEKLANRWGWGRSKLRNFLKTLKNDHMIDKKSTNKQTTITILNYAVYQGSRTSKKPADVQQKNIRRTTDEHKQEYKEYKEVVVPPQLFEISSFCSENGLNVNAEKFFKYYSERGWKTSRGELITDWKSLVEKWSETERDQQPVVKKRNNNTFSGLPLLGSDDDDD